MRSLTLKLSVAFLIVGVVGVALVTLFVRQRTQQEFDQLVLNRFQRELVDDLTDYYRAGASWNGIDAILMLDQARGFGRRGASPAPVTLLDANYVVVYSARHNLMGTQLPPREGQSAVQIEVDGNTVGWLLFEGFPEAGQPTPDSSESGFLGSVQEALWLGALGAIVVALLIGVFLARTISRPVRELTAATQIVAQGTLGYQVPVRTKDELGELAASFNRMSADLSQSNELRRQMTADIAHELRTPLSVILGYTEALSDGKLEGSPETFEIVHDEAQRLGRLVEDLRTLSLAEAGELSLTRRPVSARALLERTALAHTAQARQLDVSLQVEAGEDLPQVEVDADRMAQVLSNLVSNALRHTPAGGQIILSARQRSGRSGEGPAWVTLHVRDTGSGIAPQDLPYVFDRFYRGDKSRHQQQGETGLGLSIAKSIVEAHGGAISAQSELGHGTTMAIDLPAPRTPLL